MHVSRRRRWMALPSAAYMTISSMGQLGRSWLSRVVTGLDIPALVSQDPIVVKVLHERVEASGKLWCVPSGAVRCLAHKVPFSLTQCEP
jgi:hypothetical protein